MSTQLENSIDSYDVVVTEPLAIDRARCADGEGGLTHLFFSDDAHDLARAKSICSKCLLADDCRSRALERAEYYGVWGGVLSRHGDLADGGDLAGADEIVDLVLLHQELDALGQVVDDLVLAAHHGPQIELEAGDLHTVVGEFVRRHLVVVRRLQQRLRRDAADVETGAAQLAALFHHGRLEAQLRGADRRYVTAGSAANDDDIICFAHGRYLLFLGADAESNVQHDALRVLDALFQAHQEGDRLASIDDPMIIR